MCGGNRLVSVQEVVEKEKKLKIKSLLHLHSATGSIPVQVFLSEFSEVGTEKCHDGVSFVKNFPYNAVKCDVATLLILVYIAGYAAKKMQGHLQCNFCLSLLIDESRGTFEIEIDDDISNYFENLNRGGLTYPSKLLISVYQAAYGIFSVCISPKYEKMFISLKKTKNESWLN